MGPRMSEPVLPALTGSYLIRLLGQEESIERHPIIGWEKQLGRWEPICFPTEVIRSEDPICYLIPRIDYPDEPQIFDPKSKKSFPSLSLWAKFYQGQAPVKTETGEVFEITTPVTFGLGVYKNKSFWHFKTAKAEFLFELEGGETYPDDPRVRKITRAEFFSARRMIPVVSREEVIVMGQETPEEPQPFDGEDLI